MRKQTLCAILLFAMPAFASPNRIHSASNWSCSPPANTLVVACTVTVSSTTMGNLLAVWTSWQWTSVYGATYTAAVVDGPGPGSTDAFSGAVGPTVQSATSPNPTSAQMFYAKSIASGTTSVTVTFTAPAPPAGSGDPNATLSAASVVVVEYTGLDPTNPLDSASAGYSSLTNPTSLLDSGNVAPANSNLTVLAFGVIDQNISTGLIPGSGFGSFQSVHGSGGTAVAEDNNSAITGNSVLQRATACTGATCPAATTGNWIMQMAVFRDASWTVGGGWNPPRFAQILDAGQFPGSDIGAQINNAYAALPPYGGHIVIPRKSDGSCYSFSTPIVLQTPGKYVLLDYEGAGGLWTVGSPNSGTWYGCLNFTGTSGAAITLDYATPNTISASPVHGLRNILLVNAFCAPPSSPPPGPGCGSSVVGIQIGNLYNGIHGATMENIGVSGFGIGYQTTNFTSDPVTWINPYFYGNTTGWAVGNVSTQVTYGGFFTLNGTHVASPACPPPGPCSYNSEMSFYGTSFVVGTSWVFDYSTNNKPLACCAKLDLFGVHIEQYMSSTERILQGSVDLFMSGGVAEDDTKSGTASGSDYWFNAQGGKLVLQDVEFVAGSTHNIPSIGVVNDAGSTRVKISGQVKYPTSLPCNKLIGGIGAPSATQRFRRVTLRTRHAPGCMSPRLLEALYRRFRRSRPPEQGTFRVALLASASSTETVPF